MMPFSSTIRSGKPALLVIVSLAGLAFRANAQQALSSQMADALFAESKWEPAARAYVAITAKEPANGPAWQHLGECDIRLQRYDEALNAFQHVVDLKYRPLMTKVDMARVYVAKADTRRALDLLQQVAASGNAPRLRAYIEGAGEFQKLRDNAEYQQFLQSTLSCRGAEYRQFDFWLGEWDVVTTDGHNPAGSSSVQLILDQCVVLENWTGGGTGKSFNHYDTRLKKWIQDWVDSDANGVHFEGRLENGVMSYFADSADAKGAPIRRHMQFVKLDADHVRQFSQASNDGGKTWSPEYDFTYIRKK
jgi:tetratricopeptide (TPR) repeat protein